MKKCTKCGEEKELTEFNKNRLTKDGFRSECKICCSVYANRLVKKHQSKNLKGIISPLTKVCYKCRVEKSANEFYKSTSCKDGLSGWCKLCIRADRRQFIIDNGTSRDNKRRQQNNKYRVESNNASWVNGLIRMGKLDRPTEFICAMTDCTNQAREYHHLKYDSRSTEDPISIIAPLCKDCHDLFHIRKREGIDLTDKILTQIELEYIPRKKPHIKFLKEKTV